MGKREEKKKSFLFESGLPSPHCSDVFMYGSKRWAFEHISPVVFEMQFVSLYVVFLIFLCYWHQNLLTALLNKRLQDRRQDVLLAVE